MARTYCRISKCTRWANLNQDDVCPRHVALAEKDKGEIIYKCLECDDACKSDQQALLCERCDCWVHISCAGVEQDVYDMFFKKGSKLTAGIRFFCKKCDDKVTEVIEKCSTLENDTMALKKDMVNVKASIAKIEETIKTQVNAKISNIMTNKQEIDKRKMNLVVFGLPETQQDTSSSQWSNAEKIEKDIENISQIIIEEIGVGLSPRSGIIDARRLGAPKAGNPRPLRIEFRDLNTKRDVLTNAKKLRSSKNDLCKKLYINPDLTEEQKKADEKLRKEMWVRREKGENVIIRRGAIVIAQ